MMAGAGVSERGWQIGKSLQDSNSYMLENSIACDVTFNIHSPEGYITQIQAHRYMLISRSPVFEVMLCGNFKERTSETVDIKDIEPDIFRAILRYMYTSAVTISPDNVLQLKHAASMYLLDKLVTECTQYLDQSINVENAVTILNNCVLYQEQELIQKTLAVVAMNLKVLIENESFYKLSLPSLAVVLSSNYLEVDSEMMLLMECEEWARRNSPGCEPPDRQLREILGESFYQIRFGDISPDELAKTLGMSDILTDKEFRLFTVYCTMARENEASGSVDRMDSSLESSDSVDQVGSLLVDLGFSIKQRVKQNSMTSTFERFADAGESWSCTCRTPHVIDFDVNKDIMLYGVTLYGCKRKGSSLKYVVQVYTDNMTSLMTSEEGSFVSTGCVKPARVHLGSPLRVQKGIKYSVKVTCPPSLAGNHGTPSVSENGVLFTFHTREEVDITRCTNVYHGQIPGLLYLPL